jgi:broad specificity phosphatase PhoE
MSEKYQSVIFFIRHGQTDRAYTQEPKTDDLRHLSEQGRGELEKIGVYLAQFSPVKIYTSPLHRTQECAEIIAKHCNPIPDIEQRKELYEIYSDESYHALARGIPEFFNELVTKHAGDQIVCVSHGDVIQGGLDAYTELTEAEKASPCLMGEGYRLVFADTTLVECQKIRPAYEI